MIEGEKITEMMGGRLVERGKDCTFETPDGRIYKLPDNVTEYPDYKPVIFLELRYGTPINQNEYAVK